MALVFSDDIWDRWRLPALALAAAAIIVVPWLTLRKLQQDNEQAMAWVTHTQQVTVALQQLQTDVRDIESAALTLSKGVDAPGLRERMAKANDIPERLAELGRMTRDNPDQLIRIGRIQSMLEGRMGVARELARSEPNSDQRELVQDLSTRYPIRGLVEELQASEEALLAQRAAQAERQKRQTNFVSWSSLVVQLALLGLVLWLLQRQIGRRLQAERQSQRAAARAASVLQTVREPIVLLDRELRVQLHNPAFSELYGLQDERADGLLLENVGEGAWRDPVVRQRLADVLLRGRELWDFEHEQRGADGMSRYMLLNARRMPLPDTDDEVVLLTVSDVTVQRAVQTRVEELNRQLEGKVAQVSEVNRELEAFSYSVSHDLRAPLRHVAGFSDKLSRHLGEAADEKSQHYLGVISGSARRMATLIDDLLVYSRLGRAAMRQQTWTCNRWWPIRARCSTRTCRARPRAAAMPIRWSGASRRCRSWWATKTCCARSG